MAYEKIYERINWANRQVPSLGATNLNRLDFVINELDDRVVELSKHGDVYATKEEVTEISGNVIDVSNRKADVILANVSGESIRLTDSTDSKAVEFALHGKATQKQYAGRNLLENKGTNQTIAGVTYTKNEDGSVTLNGTCEYGTYQYVVNDDDMSKLPNGTYMLCTFSNVKGKSVWIRYVMSDNTSMYVGLGEKKEITITDDYKINRVRIHVNASAVLENFTISALLCKSTETDTTYEPYVGGVPSPNPDYPQDIEVSGADGSVEVESIGKNFIPYPYHEKNHTDNGIAWTNNGDGRLTANGTATGNSDYFMIHFNAMRTFKAGTYIVNGCPVGGGESTHSVIVGKVVNGTFTRIVLANESGASFTLEEDTEIYVACRVSTGKTVSNLIFEPMISLEGGEYESYKESIVEITTTNGIAGIKVSSGGNYTDENGQRWVTDEIVKHADGSGKYIQRIAKAVFDGSEEWDGGDNNTFVLYSEQFPARADLRPLCNSYITTTTKVADMPDKSVRHTYWMGQTRGFIAIRDTAYATINDFKAGLSAKNIICYTAINPIITDLSAEEIAELEVQTFYPTTNILNDANCGMEVTYKADTKNYIDKIIGERVSALETALINNI